MWLLTTYLTQGGPAVTTCIYDDMYTIKTVEQIPERKWHRLKTDVLHCVHGITTNRVALSLDFGPLYNWGDPLPIGITKGI